MSIKSYKPTTPSRRYITNIDFRELARKKPEKSLLRPLKKKAGRSKTQGRITIRHRGGGHKRKYRVVDFKRTRFEQEAEVRSIEYDPNRSAFIALIEYKDGKKSYILAADGLAKGDKIIASKNKQEARPGNRMPLKYYLPGNFVYNIELEPGRGGQIVRAAGSGAQIMSHEGKYTQIKLPSGEIRNVLSECLASCGRVSNPDHGNIVFGKAGRKRWKGIRPTVRGKAMNPVDHPHGGGEGRSPVGLVHPKTPWGRPALGVKTRKKGKKSDRLIIKRRK